MAIIYNINCIEICTLKLFQNEDLMQSSKKCTGPLIKELIKESGYEAQQSPLFYVFVQYHF